MEKNKALTKERIIKAFDEILIHDGFQNLGINTVAQKAGVSKVLIYRYFGDFNGLLQSYLEEKAYWLNQNNEIEMMLMNLGKEKIVENASLMFRNLLLELSEHKEKLEFERWILSENNEVNDAICSKIEEPTADRNRLMSEKLGIDESIISGVIALLNGGITYLSLRAKTAPFYNNINLRDKSGMDKLMKSIDYIFIKLLT